MKFNGVISNSIFCVIHKSFCSILHCVLVFSILVIHVMWREVLCDGNCFRFRNVRTLYIHSLGSASLFLHSLQILTYTCIHMYTYTNIYKYFGKVKGKKRKFCSLHLVA